MKQEPPRKFYVFLPWMLLLAVLGAFALFGAFNKEEPNPFAPKSMKIKVDLLAAMRIHLLEAIEAEKNAVMAITDAASEDFAAQARQASDELESNRKAIATLILQEKHPQEITLLNEFNACWSQFRNLDETILNLATQNTNFKAQKLSATQAAQEITLFEESLNRLIQRSAHGNQCGPAVMPSYAALTAGLKIFALHKPHIEEADDRTMDEIERRMKSYDESARKALGTLRNMSELRDSEDLKNAVAAYEQFMDLTGDVLKLSRMNTNIKSEELSLGKKRLLASQCQAVLAELQETIQPHSDYALPRSKKRGME